MGGKSKKKAAKKASAEVKASFAEAATAAARRMLADPEDDDAPSELGALIRLIARHAYDDDKTGLVEATHAHVLRSLGPVPCGQSLPESYGEMLFLGLAMFNASQRGLVGEEVDAYCDEQVKEGRLAHATRTDRELRDHLADEPAERIEKLRLVLSGRIDAYAIQEIVILGPVVHVGPAGHKGDGVFALRDIPPGQVFTAYPCHGLWVGGHGGRDLLGRFFTSPMLFPCWEGELNLEYAVNTTKAGDRRQTLLLGHKSHHRWFACGHIINDSHTVEEAGGADNYRAVANGNCEPRVTDDGSVVMITNQPVVKGQELLYNYGVARWTASTQRLEAGDLARRMQGSGGVGE